MGFWRLRLVLLAAEELIAAGNQGRHFSVGHASGQHPEAAIGVHPLDPFDAQHVDRVFDS
ncbi:uncharacterized protein METZ01_LOCUS103745, partial [marine metagenome]